MVAIHQPTTRAHQARPPEHPYVLARWRAVSTPQMAPCGVCGAEVHDGDACPSCGRSAPCGDPVGRLAVVTVIAGRRIAVVAERDPAGGWSPVEVDDATGARIRQLRTQDRQTLRDLG